MSQSIPPERERSQQSSTNQSHGQNQSGDKIDSGTSSVQGSNNRVVQGDDIQAVQGDKNQVQQIIIKDLISGVAEKQLSQGECQPHHNLPQPDYGKFIGREKEQAKVLEKLRPYPYSTISVITIDGIGGIGKSALALEISLHFLRNYDSLPPDHRFDAIVWTSAKRTVLRADRGIVSRRQAFQTLDDICKTIAITLRIEEPVRSQPEERVELICRELTRQRTLLIIDNLETVDDEFVMEFLQDLLPAPTKAIVTTRHRIDVAYPIRLRGMPWEDAAILIEQECQKKEVNLNDEQKHKLYERTGGVPLAIVWTVAKIGFGSSINVVLAGLGNKKGDIARFCFEDTIKQIRDRDAYKLLLALALYKGDVSREKLGYVAGFGEDEFSRDDGLVELDRLSLVSKIEDKFSLLPLTREYVNHELESAVDFKNEAIRRLSNYEPPSIQLTDWHPNTPVNLYITGRTGAGKTTLWNILLNKNQKVIEPTGYMDSTCYVSVFRMPNQICIIDLPGVGSNEIHENINRAALLMEQIEDEEEGILPITQFNVQIFSEAPSKKKIITTIVDVEEWQQNCREGFLPDIILYVIAPHMLFLREDRLFLKALLESQKKQSESNKVIFVFNHHLTRNGSYRATPQNIEDARDGIAMIYQKFYQSEPPIVNFNSLTGEGVSEIAKLIYQLLAADKLGNLRQVIDEFNPNQNPGTEY